MKKVLILIAVVSFLAACSSKKTNSKIESSSAKETREVWSQSSSLDAPESAYYDVDSGVLFVSNVGGQPDKKDGNGWISQFEASSGRILKDKWVSGLNAPKGMRTSKGVLWVSDIDEVLGIEIKSGKIKNRVQIKGAKFLNDIAVGSKGEVYVSDMAASRIYKVRGKSASIFVQGPEFESPNGLLISQGKLVVAGWGREMAADFSTKEAGHLYSIDLRTKKKTLLTKDPLGHLDGLEMDSDGNYIVSDWMAGKVFFVSSSGESSVILDGFKGAADIGWVQAAGLLVVPRMMENRVSAYQLK